MSQYTQTQKAQKLVDDWNKTHGVGLEVEVKMDDGVIFRTTTRSKAQLLPSGQPVVWVVGIVGCYDLERVTPKPAVVDPATGAGAFLNTLGNPPYGVKDGEG